jgi:hypothetical protein
MVGLPRRAGQRKERATDGLLETHVQILTARGTARGRFDDMG